MLGTTAISPDPWEERLTAALVSEGYGQFELGKIASENALQNSILDLASEWSGRRLLNLAQLHEILPSEKLNEFRMAAIRMINTHPTYREDLLQRMHPLLRGLLGPDLAVQKNLSLVLSLPGDETSQIPLHSDVMMGHSPFELNLWIPWTPVSATQSMFLLPLSKWRGARSTGELKEGTLQGLFEGWRDSFEFLSMDPGQAVLFWHHLPHGNVVNRERTTRWSLNVRFKNLFSPYGEKGLGDYFVPWKYGPVTEISLRDSRLWV